MILQWFAEMFYNILEILLGRLYLPNFPDSVYEITNYINMIIENGSGIVAFFINVKVMQACFVCCMGIVMFEGVYDLVMYILKKVPVAGIK